MLVVGGYIIYGLNAGLPIDQLFLGSGPAHSGRSGGARISPWTFFAVVESALLFAFILCRYAESDMKGHRVFSGLIGAVGLYLLLMTTITSQNISRLDSCLALYVWCSHICYALFGGSED